MRFLVSTFFPDLDPIQISSFFLFYSVIWAFLLAAPIHVTNFDLSECLNSRVETIEAKNIFT